MIAGGNQLDHLRRAELAADAGQEPLGLPAEEGLAQRRRRATSPTSRRPSATPTARRPRRRPRRPLEPRRPGRRRGQPEGPLLVYKNTVAPDNAWIGFDLEARRPGSAPAGARTAAPSAREVRSSGTARSSCRRSPAAAATPPRISAPLHFGLGKAPRWRRPSSAGPPARCRRSAAARGGPGPPGGGAGMTHRLDDHRRRVVGQPRGAGCGSTTATSRRCSSPASCSSASSPSASWRATRGPAGDRVQHRRWSWSRSALLVRQVAAPGQRLHLRASASAS